MSEKAEVHFYDGMIMFPPGTYELVIKREREKEREACAKVCDLVAREIDDTNGNATYCAAAIRARGKNE